MFVVFDLLKGSWEIIKELVDTKPTRVLKGDLLKFLHRCKQKTVLVSHNVHMKRGMLCVGLKNTMKEFQS